MVRGATRFAACAALALGLVAAAFSSQAHAQTPLPPKGSAPAGESQGPAGPGSIIGDPGGAPVVRPAIRPQSLLGRETNAASIRGEVVMRQNGQRMTYQVVTPNGEQINQATMLGLTQRAGQPVYAVGVNELLVGFRNPTTLAEATAFFRQHGLTGEVTRKALLRDVFMVRTDTALRAFQAGDAFVSDARVRFAHPDLYAEMRTTDPELQLMQGMTTIMSGGMYDFGMTTQGTPVSADFTITNTGDMGLSISVGSVPTGFTVNTPFPANPIPPGGTFDFTVTLDAEMAGAPNGDLEILNNTATNPFVITLSGMVNMPMGPADLRVTLMGAEVDNGSNVSFGTTSVGAAVVRTFTIHNDGGDPLTIGAVSVPGGFTVTSQPMGPVAGGTSTVFSVQLDALMDGTYTGQLSFLNNDADDNPYTITISGTVSTGGSGEEIDDPLYVDQWHLNNTGQGNGVEMVDINAEAAWALTLGDGALIAIMDSSIQPDHPDYAGNVVPCVDCVNFFDLPSNPDTGIGNHGTAVTGLVAAVDNMIGVRGGAPNANVIVTSYIGLDGNGLSVAETAENWAAAAAEGASVHTNSWGYSNETFLPDISRDTIIDLTNNARDGRGMLFLFATANSFTLTTYGSALASMEETLGVSGVGNDGERAIYANYGLGADVTGPTEGNDLAITTTDVTGEGGYNDDPSESGGDYTNSFNGTSASTPIIAGVAALAISENENLHAAQLKRLLLHTASANAARNTLLGVENLGFSGITSFSESYGYGMPDARAAVAAARQSISNGNLTWPATARNLTVNASPTATSIMWTNPPAGPKGEFAGALVVRLGPDVAWKPVDGITYTVGDNPAEGVTVVAVGNITSATDMGNTTANSATYAVFIRNGIDRYSFGVTANTVQSDGTTVFSDNFESDFGWFVANGEWERGSPTIQTVNIQIPNFSGGLDEFTFETPPRTRGFNSPRSGANVFGTDLNGTYTPDTEHILFSPVIDLENSDARNVYLTYWELLEIESNNPGTFVSVDVVEPDTSNPTLIRTLRSGNPGNLYTWTPRRHDVSQEIGRRFRIRFTLTADDIIGVGVISQFQGWFLDDVRFVSDGTIVQPPPGTRRPGLVRLPPPGGFLFDFFGYAGDSGGTGDSAPITQSPDVNGDGTIDALDVGEVAKRFGATRGDGAYAERYDFDSNGEISYFDLVISLVVAADPSSYSPVEIHGEATAVR